MRSLTAFNLMGWIDQRGDMVLQVFERFYGSNKNRQCNNCGTLVLRPADR